MSRFPFLQKTAALALLLAVAGCTHAVSTGEKTSTAKAPVKEAPTAKTPPQKIPPGDKASISAATLDGVWIGDLRDRESPSSADEFLRLRLEIDGDRIVVTQLKKDGKSTQTKPGKFRITRHLTNAVIVAIDSATDDDGTWVETWLIAITAKDPDTLIARWNRLVNNTNLVRDAPDSKFSYAAMGDLVRVSRAPPQDLDYTLIPGDRHPRTYAEMKAYGTGLVKEYPGDPWAHWYIAHPAARTCDFTTAKTEVLATLDLAVKNPYFAATPEVSAQWRRLLTLLLLLEGNLPEALQQANAVLAEQPHILDYLRLRTQINQRLGNMEAALADAHKMVEVNETSVSGWVMRSGVHYAMGRYAEALADRNRAMEVDAKSKTTDGGLLIHMLERGRALAAMGEYQNAIDDYENALKTNQDPETGAWLQELKAHAAAALAAASASNADGEKILTNLRHEDANVVPPTHSDCE